MEKKEYTVDDITVLVWQEVVRKRPAMYLGNSGFQGFMNILKDFFAPFYQHIERTKLSYIVPFNYVDAEKYCFEITGKQSGIFRFERLATSVPSTINETLHSGGYDFAVLNALSQNYEFTLFYKNGNEILKQVYQQGILQNGFIDEKEYFGEILEIKFDLDTTILDDFIINPHFISEVIQELAFLNKDKTFEIKYLVNNEPCRNIYHFEKGLRDLVEIKGFNGWGSSIFDTELEFQSEDFSADICFKFWDYSINESFFKSFVNNHYTHKGGTHKKALLSGISKGIKKYVREHTANDFFVINEHTILSHLIGTIHLKMKQPSFYGSFKGGLSNPEIIKPISDFVFEYVYKKLKSDEETALKIIRHFYEIHWNKKWLKR